MDVLMTLVSGTTDSCILPIPSVYSIPGEMERQETTGMCRQITLLIPGVIASSVCPRLSHEKKLIFVRNMAISLQACWESRFLSII